MGEELSRVTRLLFEWRNGRREALDELTPIIYRELHKLASSHMRKQRAGHPLQPTALVNEAYLRLLGSNPPDWQNRSHFIAAIARIMRQVLVDAARRQGAQKRDFGRQITLDDGVAGAGGSQVEIILLNRALDKLAETHPRRARVVELRYFSGLNLEETAEALGLTVPTVRRDAALAQSWLREAMVADAVP